MPGPKEAHHVRSSKAHVLPQRRHGNQRHLHRKFRTPLPGRKVQEHALDPHGSGRDVQDDDSGIQNPPFGSLSTRDGPPQHARLLGERAFQAPACQLTPRGTAGRKCLTLLAVFSIQNKSHLRWPL